MFIYQGDPTDKEPSRWRQQTSNMSAMASVKISLIGVSSNVQFILYHYLLPTPNDASALENEPHIKKQKNAKEEKYRRRKAPFVICVSSFIDSLLVSCITSLLRL